MLDVCQFFTTNPLPCDPSSLPKFPPSKEFDAKRRDKEAIRYYVLINKILKTLTDFLMLLLSSFTFWTAKVQNINPSC